MVDPISSEEMEMPSIVGDQIICPFKVLVIKTISNGLDHDSKILLNQIHSIDHQARLQKYCG